MGRSQRSSLHEINRTYRILSPQYADASRARCTKPGLFMDDPQHAKGRDVGRRPCLDRRADLGYVSRADRLPLVS